MYIVGYIIKIVYYYGMGSKYTEAQKKATQKYKADKITRLSLDIKKEDAAGIKAEAKKRGVTITGFILSAVRYYMDNGPAAGRM